MKIVFVCSGGPNYFWNDSNGNTGIGGSEECLIMLSREFAKLGHQVTVFNNCGPLQHDFNYGDGYVRYMYYNDYKTAGGWEVDLLISWRDWYTLLEPGIKAKKKFHSSHDVPVSCHHPHPDECNREQDNALKTIDKIVYLNNYHRNLSPWWPDEQSFVCPIGIDQRGYTPPSLSLENGVEEIYRVSNRDPARVLFFSHPNRGLDQLRAAWPQIKQAVPEATLASYWWEPEHYRPPIPELGILPMEHLGSEQIAKKTERAGIFGYPCVFAPEISPATTIKAQAGGAYPVVVMQGGMVDTVQYGIQTTHAEFAETMIYALRKSIAGALEEERQEMMTWARKTYNWTNVAKAWIDEYNRQI